MIYCKLSELRKYKSCSKNMEKAIDFILANDLRNLPIGKTPVDGEKIFVHKSKIETKDVMEQKYEVHYKYIDIHIDIEGNELIYLNNNLYECVQDYKNSEDYALYNYYLPEAMVTINDNYCAIIFPNENHMPCIRNKSKTVLKCVIKVLDE